MFEDGACSIGFDLYPSQHLEGLCLHACAWGRGSEGEDLCQGQLCNMHMRLPFSCQDQHYS